jgi:hypothetical protein
MIVVEAIRLKLCTITHTKTEKFKLYFIIYIFFLVFSIFVY